MVNHSWLIMILLLLWDMSSNPILGAIGFISFVILPLTIFSTMIGVYTTVLEQEKRMSRFGRGSVTAYIESDENRENVRENPRVRKVMYRALSYSGAWFATYIFTYIRTVALLVDPMFKSFILQILIAIFLPLQGFFNFLIFIYPKISQIRLSNPETSILKAFTMVLQENDGEVVSVRRRNLRPAAQHDDRPQNNV